jgi:hypothetical protein
LIVTGAIARQEKHPMRMSQDDYSALQTALLETLKGHNIHPFMVQSTANAWNVFHKAWNEGRLDGGKLYDNYNDAHIETALKAIFKR